MYPPVSWGGYICPRTDVPSCRKGWVLWAQDRCTLCLIRGWVLWSQARCTPLFHGVGTLVPGQMYPLPPASFGVGTLVPGQMYPWGGVGIFVLGQMYPWGGVGIFVLGR